MYPLFGWPFHGIPGPSDWVKAIADMFLNSQIGLLKFAVNLLFASAPPPRGVVEADWFSYLLSDWTDVGINLMALVIILTHLLLLLRLGKDFGKTYAKLGTSFIGLAIFIRLYYPGYALLHDGVTKAESAIIAEFTSGGKSSLVDQLTKLAAPDDVMAQFLGYFIAWILTLIVASVSGGLLILWLANSVVYPVFLVLRPAHRFFDAVWHWLNAGLLTVFVSPVLMVFSLCLCIFTLQKSEDSAIPGSGFVGLLSEMIALVLCSVIPPLVFWLAHRRSVEVFGKLESSIEGSVNIASSEPLSIREANDRINDNHTSVIKEVGTSALVATIDDKPGEPMSRRLLDIAATAATASGHMEVAAVAQVAKSRIPDQPERTEGGSAA